MASADVKQEIAKTEAKIEELEEKIEVLQTECEAALVSSKPEALITAYKEEKQRLVALQSQLVQQLAMLLAKLPSQSGAPCSASMSACPKKYHWL